MGYEFDLWELRVWLFLLHWMLRGAVGAGRGGLFYDFNELI